MKKKEPFILKFPKCFLIVFILTAFLTDSRAEITPEMQQGLTTAIKSYQEGKFTEASEKLNLLSQKYPDQAEIIFNQGLAAFKLKKTALAAGLWRKSLNLDPTYSPASKALDFVEGQLPSPLELSGWEAIRKSVLNGLSVNVVLGLLWILLGGTGFLWLRYLGTRSRAFQKETPLPPAPGVAIGLSIASITALLLLSGKILDHIRPRATVIAETASVKSAPTVDSPDLVQLQGGSEVIIFRRVKDWAQVQPIGGITGWVSREKILQTSGKDI